MAPRPTKGKNFMLEQLYEVENVSEELRHTDEYIGLTVNQILKRISIAKKATDQSEPQHAVEDDERPYRPWTAF
jgi:hypothetical protein